MFIDLAAGEMDWRSVYRLCIGFVNPRPIALVSSVSSDGRVNLAPFSFYNMVCGRPPVVMFCPGLRRDGRPKDTLVNIRETNEFAIATVTAPLARRMVDCAADLPYGESEFAFSGLTPTPGRHVAAPLVRESPINIECRLREIKVIGEGPGSSSVVFGDILAIHLDDGVLHSTSGGEDGPTVDPRKLPTVGRLGGAWYADVAQPYELQIPPADR